MGHGRRCQTGLIACAISVLFGCNATQFDLDLRDNAYSTSGAVKRVLENRPTPDELGIITYPNYQIAVARSGDSLQKLAKRIGVDAESLARYNGIKTDDKLRSGEIIALPGRLAVSSGAEINETASQDIIDVTNLAKTAILNSPDKPQKKQPVRTPPGEPVRHKVLRGETAFTISRLYNVSIRSLAEWNGLDGDFRIREGQYLLIPITVAAQSNSSPQAQPVEKISKPGSTSKTPLPPSASTPLPSESDVLSEAVQKAKQKEKTPIATPIDGSFAYPVSGRIIRDYVANKTEGIDFSAPAGTKVVAAQKGVIAAITEDANKVPIIVIKHANSLLSVYANIGNIPVNKGQSVTKGQTIGQIREGEPPYLHFEIRDGLRSVDPMDYLN